MPTKTATTRFGAIAVGVLFAVTLSGCEAVMSSTERMCGFTLLATQTIQTAHRIPSGFEGETAGDSPGAVEANFSASNVTAQTGPDPVGCGLNTASARAIERPQRPGRLMVYSARFQISTPNVDDSIDRLAEQVARLGGYLESRLNATVVCRVPAEHCSELVAAMPSLGGILNQAMASQDVTREHRDLGLRLETAEWSRRRVLALLERAEKIEDVLKLEEELRRLTEQVERLKGELRHLSEKITYSRVEVTFQNAAVMRTVDSLSTQSTFAWVNRVGVEQVLSAFSPVTTSADKTPLSPSLVLPGAVSANIPDGFLVVEKDREQIKVVSPDESKLWVRDLPAARRADLSFWSEALKNHLIRRRGYTLVEERPVENEDGQRGRELLFQVVTRGVTHRYLVTLHVRDGLPWSSKDTIRVSEFVASGEAFDRHIELVRRSTSPVAVR